MHWLVFLHLLGAALYVGAAVSALVTERRIRAALAMPAAQELLALERSLGRLTGTGVALIVISGVISLLARGWLDAIAVHVWLHIMITAAVASAALDGIASGSAKRALKLLEAGEQALAAALISRTHHLRLAGLLCGLLALAAGVWRWKAG